MSDQRAENIIRASTILLENTGDGMAGRQRCEFKRFHPQQDIWAQANDALRRWAKDAPSGDRYHKIEVIVIYSDDATFSTCSLLQHENWSDETRAPDLGEQIRASVEMLAGLRRPPHFTTRDYLNFLHTFGRRSRDFHTRLLRDYELPGASLKQRIPENFIETLTATPKVVSQSDFTTNRPPA